MGLTDGDLIELLKVIRTETRGLIAEIAVVGDKVELEVETESADEGGGESGNCYICGKVDDQGPLWTGSASCSEAGCSR